MWNKVLLAESRGCNFRTDLFYETNNMVGEQVEDDWCAVAGLWQPVRAMYCIKLKVGTGYSRLVYIDI